MTEKISIKGEIVQTGSFEGNIVYLKEYGDLSQVNDGTLLVLDDCPKSLAILGMQRARATIKIGESETSHLVLCAEPEKPFASVDKKEAEKLLNGSYLRVEFIDTQKSAA